MSQQSTTDTDVTEIIYLNRAMSELYQSHYHQELTKKTQQFLPHWSSDENCFPCSQLSFQALRIVQSTIQLTYYPIPEVENLQNMTNSHFKYFHRNPTVSKNCSSDQVKLLKFEA